MNTEPKIITIPDADELLRRLIAIDDEPHLEERFYPRLLPLAGQERVGRGIVVALTLAVADYTEGMPPFMRTALEMRLHEFLPAFTDDADVLAEARDLLVACGLLDAPQQPDVPRETKEN